MNPILAFYRNNRVRQISGEFACEKCSRVTYNAVYDIAKLHTFWVCKWCEHENHVEGKEMAYDGEE